MFKWHTYKQTYRNDTKLNLTFPTFRKRVTCVNGAKNMIIKSIKRLLMKNTWQILNLKWFSRKGIVRLLLLPHSICSYYTSKKYCILEILWTCFTNSWTTTDIGIISTIYQKRMAHNLTKSEGTELFSLLVISIGSLIRCVKQIKQMQPN